jgi:ABC-type uncharacterized transport system substrate-binding protein
MQRLSRLASFTAILAGGLAAHPLLAPRPALAHPHVYVTVEATVMVDGGAFTGLHQVWTFDEFYSAMAVEGLDTNKDGKFDRQELSELAKVNMEGLKEFAYFTHARLGDKELKVTDPVEYWLEYSNSQLLLHFKLPLTERVLTEAKGFTLQISDPSYFIAFELAKKDPVKLAAEAPKVCKVRIGVPRQDAAEARKLGEAFFGQLGGDYGFGLAKTISIACDGR